MANALKLKGLELLPLWRRRIPKYPVYWHGNPQLRVTMPLFWMKLIRPLYDIPNTQVHFIVHPQMSTYDIKNYLEKIYKVPVLDVSTAVIAGGDIKHPSRNHVMAKEDDYKVAHVELGDGVTFDFPDLFGGKQTSLEKTISMSKQNDRVIEEGHRKQWDRLSVPPWFR